MFNELNKQFTNTVKEGIDTDKMEFKKLKDFIGKTIKVDGFYISKGNYGEQVVIVGNGFKINMPARATDTFKAIRQDEKMVKAILDGKMEIINIAEVKAKNGNETVSYELHDC